MNIGDPGGFCKPGKCVGWVAAIKAATHRDECMMGSATRNPSYSLREPPPQPFAQAAPHYPLFVFGREPRNLFGKHGHCLAIGTREPRKIRSPEHAPCAKRIVYAAQVRVQRAIRVRILRVMRKATDFHRDIRASREYQYLVEVVLDGVDGLYQSFLPLGVRPKATRPWYFNPCLEVPGSGSSSGRLSRDR